MTASNITNNQDEALALSCLETYKVHSDNDTYQNRVLGLLKRFYRESDIEKPTYEMSELISFGQWMTTILRPTLSPNSWRAYRYQVHVCLPYSELRSLIDVPPSTPKSSISKRTSAERQRHLKQHDMERLIDFIRRSQSNNGHQLADLLIASECTGLRPSEWPSCTYELTADDEPYLAVVSAQKGIKQDVSSPYRYIPLTHLTPEQSQSVSNTLIMAKNAQANFKGGFSAKQAQLTGLMKRCTRYVFGEGRRPSIYSARHQFAANLKKSQIEPSIISLVLGHASIELQTHYYGRGVNGYVIPFDEELAHSLNGKGEHSSLNC